MTDKQIQRTYAEEFRLTYGYDWPYEHRICTGALPAIEGDDMSELYWQVLERCRELGIETDILKRLRQDEDDATGILKRLRQAEDDALDWLNEHGIPQREYDEMIAEYEAQYDRWED